MMKIVVFLTSLAFCANSFAFESGSEVRNGVYTNDNVKIRFAVPAGDFQIRTANFKQGWGDQVTLAEFESSNLYIQGALLHQQAGVSVGQHADWRETESKKIPNIKSVKRVKESRVNRSSGKWLLRELILATNQNRLHVVMIYGAVEGRNFELLLFVNDQAWNQSQATMYQIIDSLRYRADAASPRGTGNAKCSRCGKAGRGDQKFCSDCGGTMVVPQPKRGGESYKCFKCGKAGGADQKFCSECGGEIVVVLKAPKSSTPKCTQCRREGKAGQKFCADCGGKMSSGQAPVTHCPSCRTQYAGQERFCGNCGQRRPGGSSSPRTRDNESDDNFQKNLDKFMKLLHSDKFREAEDLANQMIASDRNSYVGWLLRGLARSNLGNYSQAIADFSRSIQLGAVGDDKAMALAYRGTAYHHLGRYRDALADLREASRMDPKTWEETLRASIRELERRVNG